MTYIIALQHGNGLSELAREPRLPPNARIVNHPNHCFDIGTVGWVLDNHVPDVRWDPLSLYAALPQTAAPGAAQRAQGTLLSRRQCCFTF